MPVRATAIRYALGFAIALLIPGALSAETRTWTDSTGKFKIEADFVEIVEGQVKLERADGKKMTLPLAKLSDSDRTYLRELLRKRRPSSSADASVAKTPEAKSPQSGLGRPAFPASEAAPRSTPAKPAPVRGPTAQWDYRDLPRPELLEPTVGPPPADLIAPPPPSSNVDVIDLGRRGFFENVRAFSTTPSPSPLALVAFEGGEASGSLEVRLEIVDLKAGRIVQSLAGPTGLDRATLSPSGKRLATVCSGRGPVKSLEDSKAQNAMNGTIDVWDVTPDGLKHVVSWQPYGNGPHALSDWIAWRDDDHLFTHDGFHITYWSLEGPKPLYQLDCLFHAPGLSRTGKHLVFGAADKLKFYEATTGKLIGVVPTGSSSVLSTAFSPSGGELAAIDGNKGVTVYQLPGGDVQHKFTLTVPGAAKPIEWQSDRYLYVTDLSVIDLERETPIWNYRSTVPMQVKENVAWILVGKTDQYVLMPFKLPHPVALAASGSASGSHNSAESGGKSLVAPGDSSFTVNGLE